MYHTVQAYRDQQRYAQMMATPMTTYWISEAPTEDQDRHRVRPERSERRGQATGWPRREAPEPPVLGVPALDGLPGLPDRLGTGGGNAVAYRAGPPVPAAGPAAGVVLAAALAPGNADEAPTLISAATTMERPQ
jgi:hypothetical protein